MRRGIPIRNSRAAGWARLCGGLALPVLALGVLGTRIGMVPQPALEPVLLVGFALGLAALGLGLYSLADIWSSGAEGAWTAIAGILYASPVLVILGFVAAAAIVYPRLTDIATDVNDPPLFIGQSAQRGAPDAGRLAVQAQAYPDIVPHFYPLPLGEVYLAARHVVDTRGWSVVRDVHPEVLPTDLSGPAPGQLVAEDDELVQALALKSVVTQSRGGMATETRPAGVADNSLPFSVVTAALLPEDQATIDVLAPTPVFRFVDDVTVRIRATTEGTRVDVRSASRSGLHDLGQNARRIRSFFAELDLALQPEPGTPSPSVASQ